MKFTYMPLQSFIDERGMLTPLELENLVPFSVRRIYFLTDTKLTRGGHAHREEKEFFVCVQGSFVAKIHDGKEWRSFPMAGHGLFTDAMVWHEFHDFSHDAVMLALSSTKYEGRKGYIMDFETFLKDAVSA